MPTGADQIPANASAIRRRLDGHDRAIRELRAANGTRSSSGTATSLQGVPVRAITPTDSQVLSYVQADGAWEPATLQSLDSVHVPGLIANGSVDDARAIQATLDTLDVSGAHSYEVVVEGGAGAVVYINSTVQISTSRVTLRFGSPVSFGPLGRVRIFGSLEETPATNKPKLTVDGHTGDTTITVDNAAPFTVGDYIVIRGQHDISGAVLQRMYNVITGISGLVLTLADPLDDNYLISYPASDWPSDATRITRTTSSALSASAARGDRVVAVASSASFAVGDWVQALDDSNPHDSTGVAQTSDYTHRETTQVAQIVDSTHIRLTAALHHPYLTTTRARIAKLLPVVRSSIEDAVVTWPAMSTVNTAFEIEYGVGCAIRNCVAVGGTSGSWLNQAFRQTNSWGCIVEDCTAYGPQDTSSGRGYGATLYGATACKVRGFHGISLRHSVLFFNGASGNVVSDSLSEDVRISDFDLHGAECSDNLVTGCIAIGGDSLPTDQPTGVRKAACKAGNPSHIEGDFFNTFSDMLVVNYGYNTGGGSALDVIAKSANTVFRNSRVVNAANGVTIVVATDTTLIASNTRVVACEFEDVPTVLNVSGGTSNIVQGFAFERCTIVRPTDTLTVQHAQRVTLRGNTWIDPALGATIYGVTGSNVTGLAVRGNDMSGVGRGVKLGTCPSARVTGNTMHDLIGDGTVYEDQGGNAGTLFRNNEIFGYVPITRNSGTGPSASGVTSIESQAYVSDSPSDHGWREWNLPWNTITSGTGTIAISQTLYVLKVEPRSGLPISNVILFVGAVGSGLTAGQSLVALFDDTGARLGVSADQSANWTSVGTKTISIGANIGVMAGRAYYVAILANGTTPPSFGRGPSSVTAPNAGESNANLWWSTNGTTVTAMPSTLTLASNVGTGALSYLIALS